MPDILFVQGAGPRVHDDWDLKLVESLRRGLGESYQVRYPRMPDEGDPRMDAWRPVLEQELSSLRPGAVVVGHSVGGTMLIHVLADPVPATTLAAIALIAAPFIGDGGWESDDIAARTDFGERLPAAPVLLYHGEDDADVPVTHVERYAAAIPRARVCRLAGRDHQLNNDLSEVARDIRELTSHLQG
jgi:predicted alpha/beta hydrolase family esterase